MTALPIESLTATQLATFRDALLANARSLLADATLLFEHDRFSRANSLAVLGSEELAKITPLWSLTETLDLADDADRKYLNKFMKHHSDKLALVTFMEYLLHIIIAGSPEPEGISSFETLQELEAEGQRLDLVKQDGFYVKAHQSGFILPAACITREQAATSLLSLRRRVVLFTIFNTIYVNHAAGNRKLSKEGLTREYRDKLNAVERTVRSRFARRVLVAARSLAVRLHL